MNRAVLLSAFAIALVSSPAPAGVPVQSTHVDDPVVTTLEPQDTGADFAVLDVGSQAPDFSFETRGQALRLRDLRAQGHVLLVIEPDEERLAALERERPHLLAMGVIPVAVMDMRPGPCAALANRLGVRFSMIADSRRLIGAQFNATDPNSLGDVPAWFVVDHAGRVRDLDHLSWPGRTWTDVASTALGLPGADALAPASAPGRRL